MTTPNDPTGTAPTAADPTAAIAALRSSHHRFAGLVDGLDSTGIRAPSYDADWSIAQVASHLGSQAEIFGLFLDAGLEGAELPGGERFQAIWAVWDAKSAEDMVADSITANEDFVARLELLPQESRSTFAVAVFGAEMDLAGVATMRLGEHAYHTWDVAVALDPSATLSPDAVVLLLKNLPQTAGRVGKPDPEGRDITISTTEPAWRLRLTTGPAVVVEETSGDAPAQLELPAEALLRLVAGRLDPAHTPAVVVGAELLPGLRQVFPGF